MLLGSGLDMRKKSQVFFKGILDKNAISKNAVFIFSPYKRLTRSYSGNLVKVQRTSDYTSRWFGYDKSGNLETSELLTWVGSGNDGLVEEVANQANDDYNVTQSTISLKPKIVTNGILESNGIDFNGDYLSSASYNDVLIQSPPLSIYIDYSNYIEGFYFFAINNSTTEDVQYSLLRISGNLSSILEGAVRINNSNTTASDKAILTWANTGINGLKLKIETNEATATFNNTLTNRDSLNIGRRAGGSNAITKIKSLIIFKTDESDKYEDLKNI